MTQTPPPAPPAPPAPRRSRPSRPQPPAAPFEPVLTAAMGQADSWTMAHYLNRGGYEGARTALRTMTPEEIIKVVTNSKLRRRGGAGFPAGIKWGGTRGNPAPRYLVVNADESEPGSFANRLAMDDDPHMLLEGMIICSFAVEAHTAYIYIRGENLHGFEVLTGAVREAYERGFLGKGIFGGDFDLDIYVHRGAGAYVCGEETALMESLEGKRGQPRTRRTPSRSRRRRLRAPHGGEQRGDPDVRPAHHHPGGGLVHRHRLAQLAPGPRSTASRATSTVRASTRPRWGCPCAT